MITARVSHVAAYARWKQEEDSDIGWIVNQIISNVETEAMARGTAFHKFLELAKCGETELACIDGFTFSFPGDFSLYLPKMRELRKGKDYGSITISGQVDAIEGKTIYDHKTTERFDAEGYLQSWQHRFYLDIFEADRFVWNVWEMKYNGGDEVSQLYEVRALHTLEQYRYPSMPSDCLALAQEYREFAEKYLPKS